MSMKSRALGAIWGTCVGDALGGPVQFNDPGTFKLIKDRQNDRRVTQGYDFLFKTLSALKQYQILTFDDKAYEVFSNIPNDVRRKIGTRDCRIASIALANNFKIITCNIQHFSLVPGVDCEDWTRPCPR